MYCTTLVLQSPIYVPTWKPMNEDETNDYRRHNYELWSEEQALLRTNPISHRSHLPLCKSKEQLHRHFCTCIQYQFHAFNSSWMRETSYSRDMEKVSIFFFISFTAFRQWTVLKCIHSFVNLFHVTSHISQKHLTGLPEIRTMSPACQSLHSPLCSTCWK